MPTPPRISYLLAALLLGVTLGYLFFGPSAEQTASNLETKTKEKNSLQNLSKTKPIPSKTPQATPTQNGIENDPLSTLRALHPESFQRAHLKLQREILTEMVFDLSERDPQAAARLVENADPELRAALLFPLLDNWKTSDPAAALLWLQSHKTDLSESEYATSQRSVLKAYARQDPVFVYAQLNQLAEDELRNDLLFEIAGGWADKDPSGAVAWLATLSDESISPEALTGAYVRVMESYVSVDPNAAAQAIQALDSKSLQMQLAPVAAAEIATTDLESALAWIQTLSNTDARGASIAAIASQTLQAQPEAAFEVLVSFPELYGDNGSSLSNALYSLAHREPNLLKKRFGEIPASAQAEISAALAQVWLDDPAASQIDLQWLQNLPTGEARDGSARVLANYHSGDNPSQAIRWAETLSQSAERLDLIGAVLNDSPSDQLPTLAGIVSTLKIPPDEKEKLETLLNKRLEETYSSLVLP